MLNYGSAGNGNVTHVAALSFEHAVGVQGTNVPYTGEAQALADSVADHIHYHFATSPVAIPMVKGGRLKPLAVATLKRLDTLRCNDEARHRFFLQFNDTELSQMPASSGSPTDC